MVGLLLERMPVPEVPDRVRIEVGEQRALVVGEPWARRLADLVGGLVEPPPGTTVEVDGPVRLVPAEGGLLPHLTVLGNLLHGHRTNRKAPRTAAAEECRTTADRCGLDDLLKRYPHEITAGRRRLAGVARALRAHPAVIVLEDAAGLPTWGSLLDYDRNPELLSAALLLITNNAERAAGFANV
jgi:ABC-type taurine transport system ATPase subunit